VVNPSGVTKSKQQQQQKNNSVKGKQEQCNPTIQPVRRTMATILLREVFQMDRGDVK